MKANKLKKYEKKVESPITENQHRANVNLAVEKLLAVAEKMQDVEPVAESFDELLSQMKNGVKRAPTIVNMHDGNRVAVRDGVTEIITPAITKDDTFTDTATTTLTITKDDTFTDSEKLILEQLTLEQFKNGER